MSRLSFLVVIIVASCFSSLSYAQPFFGYINDTSVIFNSTSDSYTTYFFDVQGITLNANLVILAGSSYAGKNPTNVIPRVFLRRWAPAGSDYNSATTLCQANQNVNASLNPNECVYADITANTEHAPLAALGNALPRAGRYYLSVFVPPNTLQNNQPLSFSLEVRNTQCPAGFGGADCHSIVQDLPIVTNQASPPPGTVAPGEWQYFSFMVAQTSTSQVVFTFNTAPPAGAVALNDTPLIDDTAGFYLRYGNIPTIQPLLADVIRLDTDSGSPNWIAPFIGTYVIGFYGGVNGTSYDFTLELQICAENTGGAWCDKDTRTPLSRPSCPTPAVKQCLSDLTTIEVNAEYNVLVPAETWVYSLLIVTDTQYSLAVGAKATAPGVTLVISPEAIPENNAETTAIFNLADVYPVVATLSTTTKTIYSYNYVRPGEIIIGFYGGSVDANVTFVPSSEVCPLNCNGVANACDPVSNSCTCPPVSGYTVDVHTCAKSKNDNGLSTGAIVAISILVPLGIIILIGGGLFAVWWFKFRQNAYDTI